jgi:GAF domain-containing protein
MLIGEPVRAFDLTSGVLRQNLNGHLEGMPDSGKLVAYLRGRRAPLRLDTPDHALAVPVFSHGDLAAVAFYGVHRNGSDFDPEELGILAHLATAAGAAFDRLEAAALRAENQTLRSAVQKAAGQAMASPTR